ncbi:hypothetical protein ACHAWT_006131 [Skeletonema menzelii]|mmetsp:Transcript_4383/g.7226  ORF Transcript_4383/g.7226 Transcript_4383/m.7226 type:complete len:123 (+) Transcript_4383:117-485(+)
MFRTTASIMLVTYAALVTPSVTNAFISPCSSSNTQTTSQLYNDGSSGSMEEIEFRIYPDGRVTEVVRGVKGDNCEKITEAINKQLGSVVASQPTEEMFEQEIVIDQTIQEKADGGWDGASSW